MFFCFSKESTAEMKLTREERALKHNLHEQYADEQEVRKDYDFEAQIISATDDYSLQFGLSESVSSTAPLTLDYTPKIKAVFNTQQNVLPAPVPASAAVPIKSAPILINNPNARFALTPAPAAVHTGYTEPYSSGLAYSIRSAPSSLGARFLGGGSFEAQSLMSRSLCESSRVASSLSSDGSENCHTQQTMLIMSDVNALKGVLKKGFQTLEFRWLRESVDSQKGIKFRSPLCSYHNTPQGSPVDATSIGVLVATDSTDVAVGNGVLLGSSLRRL